MGTSNNAGDKVAPNARSFDMATLLIIVIFVAQVLISIGTFPFMPARVPSHWNASGQVNGTLPRWLNAIFYPAMSLFLLVVIRGAMQISPKLGRASARRANLAIVNLILVGLLLFMLVLQLSTTAIALGVKVDITMIISLAISVLFIFLGNFMGKLRRNFWAGIRTPWTLASDTVWERTHRLGGWLFVGAGVLGIIMSFVPALRLWGLLAAVLLVALISAGYSYYAYQHFTVEGREPLSPPFDGGDVDDR